MLLGTSLLAASLESGHHYTPDYNCVGCNQVLLEQGLSCEEQERFFYNGTYTFEDYDYTEQFDFRNSPSEMIQYHCVCESSCVYFGNCCPDFYDTCPQFYPGLSGKRHIMFSLNTT